MILRLALAVLLLAAPLVAETAPGTSTPQLLSISALAFGPEGTLFVGDAKGGAVFAFEIGEREKTEHPDRFRITDLEGRLAAALGTTAEEVTIHDLAVDPRTAEMYLAVSRDRGEWPSAWLLPNDIADARILLRIDSEGEVEEVPLADLPVTHAALSNPVDPEKTHQWKGTSLRTEAITDLALADGSLWVAGLSNEEFASTVWRLPVPFEGDGTATTVEVYHGAHGEYETHAPIRTLLPYRLGSKEHLLAAYLCTPFVVFPTEDLVDGAHVRGRTVAEFGSGNYPLDMVLVRTEGRERIVIANSNLPFLVVDPEDLEAFDGAITEEPEGYTAGLAAEYRSGMGIQQLAILDADRLVAVQRQPSGSLDLVSFSSLRF